MATPAEIKILLHYYTTPDEVWQPCSMPPTSIMNKLTELGMIQEKIKVGSDMGLDTRYQITRKGEFFCEHLCSVPFPIEQYEIPSMEMSTTPPNLN